MTNASDKGDALETAVAAIERLILATAPGLRERTFVIESKKIIQVEGVHHEIDILVSIDSAPGYKSVFVFECKNWTDAVGKNEIIVFAEKIDAARAQHGYFVAKSFTKDANAQALQDSRMTLLLATEHDAATAPVPFAFHSVIPGLDQVEIELRTRNCGTTELAVDVPTAAISINGCDILLQPYLMEWADQALKKSVNQFRSERVPDGIYIRTSIDIRGFGPGEFILDGQDIESAVLSIGYKVRVVHPAVISHFEVASRGRALSFAPYSVDDTAVRIGLVIRVPPGEA
jgi:hypothetical protein